MRINETPILWEETIQPAATWSHVLKRGTALRITDLEGGANVGAIFYNFECPVERYNMPDTLKAQHIARLTTGFVLYSDMGRILLLGHGRYGRLARSDWRNVQREPGPCEVRRRPAIRKTATTATRTVGTVFWWNSASGDSARAISSPMSISSAASMLLKMAE